MGPEAQKVVAMGCLAAVAITAIVSSACDFTIVAGCLGAIAALGGVAFGQQSQPVVIR